MTSPLTNASICSTNLCSASANTVYVPSVRLPVITAERKARSKAKSLTSATRLGLNTTQQNALVALIDSAFLDPDTATIDQTRAILKFDKVVSTLEATDFATMPALEQRRARKGARLAMSQFALLARVNQKTPRVQLTASSMDMFPLFKTAVKDEIAVFVDGDTVDMNDPTFAAPGTVGLYFALDSIGDVVTLYALQNTCQIRLAAALSTVEQYEITCAGVTTFALEGEEHVITLKETEFEKLQTTVRFGSVSSSGLISNSAVMPTLTCQQISEEYNNNECCNSTAIPDSDFSTKMVMNQTYLHNGFQIRTCSDLQNIALDRFDNDCYAQLSCAA